MSVLTCNWKRLAVSVHKISQMLHSLEASEDKMFPSIKEIKLYDVLYDVRISFILINKPFFSGRFLMRKLVSVARKIIAV